MKNTIRELSKWADTEIRQWEIGQFLEKYETKKEQSSCQCSPNTLRFMFEKEFYGDGVLNTFGKTLDEYEHILKVLIEIAENYSSSKNK